MKTLTPIHLKTDPVFPWPENETVFHLLTRDGLFLCRRHPFFKSSTRVSNGPSELEGHLPFLELNYPKIPREMFERVVGFFDRIGTESGAEAVVLFAWNRTTKEVELIIPSQKSLVGRDCQGGSFPINVRYEMPPLRKELIIFGDCHSHVDESAAPSKTDMDDDADRTGLHIVVGKIKQEAPELHVVVTVDGTRFLVNNPLAVIEGYQTRRTGEVPAEWIAKVSVISWTASKGDENKL